MAQEMRWLGPPGSEIRFPDPRSALSWPNGLLATGGDLSPERLLAAYRLGIFPWYEAGQPILWWCPDPRAVIFPRELHVARRLRRFLARQPFEASFDREFVTVMRGCARDDDPDTGTWITPEMMSAYVRLHALGHAHSVEIWAEDALVGGLYGVALGRAFFAESMFSRRPNASKAAMIFLAESLRARDFLVMDCQLPSRHLATMGAREIPRRDFLELLSRSIDEHAPSATSWRSERQPVRVPATANS
ncbi:MAG: leucyl/phenylalanyl-tRNA--protein transferase [Gammaproteobacteria bacterium]